MKLNTSKPSTVKMTAELDSVHLWELVMSKVPPEHRGKLVGRVRAYVNVPSGGDWSGTQLDIHAANCPVIVEWIAEA